ncbi:MAG: Do family serine endopeptidase [Candidatus Dasytiphilus stammeri]
MKINRLTISMIGLGLIIAIASFTKISANDYVNPTTIYHQKPTLAPMLTKVTPSVVSIHVQGTNIIHYPKLPPLFYRFFGFGNIYPFCEEGSPFQDFPFCQTESNDDDIQQKETFRALGSGVIINAKQGYVVTNNHVIHHATKIQVQLHDGRKYLGTVIGKDPRTDIALIQLKNFENLTEIKFADSDNVHVGDYSIAIGNQYGLGETVTAGIISALGRSGLNTNHYEDFIQTDAAINRGNSGGPLVNLRGQLIGINTAIFAPDNGNVGIGFAIPSNMVKNLTLQMLDFGYIKRGEVGIRGIDLNSELATAMNIGVQRGAFIKQIIPKSSAFKAGIKPGDVILSINGKRISSFSTFRAHIATLPIGSKLLLGLLRDGKQIQAQVKVEPSVVGNRLKSKMIYTGIKGAILSNIEGRKGIIVDQVKPDTIASDSGLMKGDIILSVNQHNVENLAELRKIMDSKPEILVLNILRGDTTIYLLIK